MNGPPATKALLAYLSALPVAIIFGFALSGVTFEVVNTMPRSVWGSYAIGLVINLVPSLVAGLTIFALVAIWLRQRGRLVPGLPAHCYRCACLYGFALLCTIVILRFWGSMDFWMWAQLPLWAGFTTLGGLCGDLLVLTRTSHSAAHAA